MLRLASWVFCPDRLHNIQAEAGGVNMYTHLLSSVLDDWVDTFTGEALVDYALVCRAEMLASPPAIRTHRGIGRPVSPSGPRSPTTGP